MYKFNIVLKANTTTLRREGLRLVPILKKGDAALFEFPSLTDGPFWNKGVKYPIDIAFYKKDGTYIVKRQMETDQSKNVFSTEPYYYVLEANLNTIPKFKNLFDLI